jgi:hypothetical protein
MTNHEREFFIALIRSSKIFIQKEDIELEIRPLSIEQSLKSLQVYKKAYDKAYSEEIMTEADINLWMTEQGLWTKEDDQILERFNSDIEKLKIEIYNSRNDSRLVNTIKLYLRAGESQLSSHLNKKYIYYSNTCEGVASTERLSWIIKNTTYHKNHLYHFDDLSLEYVTSEYQSNFLSENQLRELARNEPWKTLWITRENSGCKLFKNTDDSELTYNQKNLLIWSQMYDSIQESLDCPSKDVIEDDDMLDGWFILQNKKREKEKLEKELDDKIVNDKIKNSSEVFVMAKDKKARQNVENLNDPSAKMIKKQRENYIHKQGTVEQQYLPDQKRNIQIMANNKMIKKVGG